MSVVSYICLPSRFHPAHFLSASPVALRYLSSSHLFPLPFFALPSVQPPCTIRGRSRLYFVFHQARIHSGVKQWEASASSSLPPSLLGFLTPWCVSAGLLREDLDEFLNRVVEKHIVEKLSMFSRALPASPFLFYSCDLYSISFSRGAIQVKGVSSWYQNMVTFYSSAHLDFKCKCTLRLKKDTTKGLERTRVYRETSTTHRVLLLRIQSTLQAAQSREILRVEFDFLH